MTRLKKDSNQSSVNSRCDRNFGGGIVGVGSSPALTSPISARDAAAAAALGRHAKVRANKSDSEKLFAERRQKQELLGKIEASYSNMQKVF
jgi:hypothetical protein